MSLAPEITDKLSQEGIFFQRWCAEKIKSRGWGILDIEFPFTYPRSSDYSIGKAGVLDIYAFTKHSDSDMMICALVECKKAHPEFKTWIFFNKQTANNLGFIQIHEGQSEVQFCKPYFPSTTPLLTYDAREVQTNKVKISHGKNEDNRIQYGSYQISHAVVGIIEDMLRMRSLGLRKYSVAIQLIFPVIITTAELYVCQYSPSDVNELGDLKHKDEMYTKVEWLLYEYPLPDYLKLPHPDLADRKRQIIVVNSRYIDKIFDELKGVIIPSG